MLLLVLSSIRTPEMDQQDENVQTRIAKLQRELVEIAGQTEIVNSDLTARKESCPRRKPASRVCRAT